MHLLRGKTILILSPQAWGAMYISKHHYAIALAQRGNTVYFLNPPEQESGSKPFIRIDATEHANLFLIHHALSFPYRLKFRALPLFHQLMRFHIKSILKTIGRPVDIIWSFDLNHLYPFRFFPSAALKIFHPVDEPLTPASITAAKGADVIFSVTREILDKYASFGAPRHLINHGVTDKFIREPRQQATEGRALHAGFSGNLLRGDLDRSVFLKIVSENPSVNFDCWGSYTMKQSNVGGNADVEAQQFIEQLQKFPNVKLHGAIRPELLADEFGKADIFLICYDVQKDQSRGTNYHKVMEYLGAGKVIVSNNVTAYNGLPDLVQMVEERDSNRQLPGLFRKILGNLNEYNSIALQSARIEFAKNNTYNKQAERIESILSGIADRKFSS